MKQFGKILKFELKGYLKNKIFVGFTLFLIAMIAVVMFLPNIMSTISSDRGDDASADRPVMLVYVEDAELTSIVNEYFVAAFTDYNTLVRCLFAVNFRSY